MTMNLEETSQMKKCPVCSSQKIELFTRGIYDSDTTEVLECVECGTQFLYPLMSQQEEDEYYEGYYKKQASRHFKTMELVDLQNRAYGYYEQYQSVYLDLIADCRSVLEIGSGTGGFLKFVLQHRPEIEIFALERCSENVKFIKDCYGDRVKLLDNLDSLSDKKFDCIGAFGVFEHIRDSSEFLISLKKHLSAKGRMALNVPNKHHALVYAFDCEAFKKFTYMKQHYYTFTEKSFHLLAHQTGLVVDKFNYIQVWGLDNQISWLRYGKPRNYSDITKLLSQKTLDSFNEDMIKNKTTDVLMAVLALEKKKVIFE